MSVLIDAPVRVRGGQPQVVHVGVKDDLSEGDDEGEEQPGVNHLDVSSGRQSVGDADEECCQHKQRGQVDCDNGLEEEGLKVVGGEADDAEQGGWDIGGQQGGKDPAAEDDVNLDCICVGRDMVAADLDILDKVLGQVNGAQVVYLAREQVHKVT